MNTKCEISNNASAGVDRATDLVRSFFQHSRGRHPNDDETVRAIARKANLPPATIRKFLQPSRRPKDVSLTVWERLVGAYRRHLNQQLAALQTEILRLEALDPSDRSARDLLDDAKALLGKIEALAGEGASGCAAEQLGQPFSLTHETPARNGEDDGT